MQAYKKEKQIGQGAFGSAWLVKSKSGGTLVAKFVNMAGMPKAGEVLRLLAPSSGAAGGECAEQVNSPSDLRMRCDSCTDMVHGENSLNHPNIIAMYEDFIDGDNLVIIMEYAGGGDLDKNAAATLTMFRFADVEASQRETAVRADGAGPLLADPDGNGARALTSHAPP
eukprot:1165895-Rhodomonas_salina.1